MFKKVSIFCLCMSLLMETGASVAFSAPNKKRAAGNRKNKRAAARKISSSKSNTNTKAVTTVAPVVDEVEGNVADTTEAVAPAVTEPLNTLDSENFDPSKPIATPRLDAAQGVGDILAKQEQAQKDKMTKELNESSEKLAQALDNAAPVCSGIKVNLDKIFGLVTATTVSSAAGTLAAGAALAVGIAKSNADKKADSGLPSLDNLGEISKEEFSKRIDDLMDVATGAGKSKILGHVRTGLMATATATSAVSLGTSIASTLNATQLADKMIECDKKISEVRIAQSDAQAVMDSYTSDAEEKYQGVNAKPLKVQLNRAKGVTQNCTGFDKGNIQTLKTKMTASAVISGVGTATAGAGTVTSVLANTDKMKAAGKSKGLDIASNVLAGVTAGTSGATAILSGTALENAKRDSDMAGRCEEAFVAQYSAD